MMSGKQLREEQYIRELNNQTNRNICFLTSDLKPLCSAMMANRIFSDYFNNMVEKVNCFPCLSEMGHQLEVMQGKIRNRIGELTSVECETD